MTIPKSFSFAEGMENYPYYKLNDEIVLPDGGYNLDTHNIGIKTIYVNMKMFNTTNARYSTDTAAAVKNFQNDNGLEATGEVDLVTWLKMGYSEEEWYGLGTYTYPVLTTRYSSREDIVNAMLKAAKDNADMGTEYRVGSSGPAGTYTDCSGLIFQCLYAAGINPEKNIVDHALAIYEYTSRNLEADEMLGVRVSKSEIEPGDLVFYQHNGKVCHVGILAGNGKMYDSWPNKGVTFRNYTLGGNILCFKRVLPNYDDYLGEVPDNSVTGKNLPVGSNSLVIYTDEQLVDASLCDILFKVTDDDVVSEITLCKDLEVSGGKMVIGATGAHAEWVFKNVHEGDVITITEDLLTSLEPVSLQEEIAEENVGETSSLYKEDSTGEETLAEKIENVQGPYNGSFHKFSLFEYFFTGSGIWNLH